RMLRGDPLLYWLEYYLSGEDTHRLLSFPDGAFLSKQSDDAIRFFTDRPQEGIQEVQIGRVGFRPCLVGLDADSTCEVDGVRHTVEDIRLMHYGAGITPEARVARLPFSTCSAVANNALSLAILGQIPYDDPAVVFTIDKFSQGTPAIQKEELVAWRRTFREAYEMAFSLQWWAEAEIFQSASFASLFDSAYHVKDKEASLEDVLQAVEQSWAADHPDKPLGLYLLWQVEVEDDHPGETPGDSADQPMDVDVAPASQQVGGEVGDADDAEGDPVEIEEA
ncbi:hypothetical protein KEM55_000210, partial [Ascosphaera atra]